MLTITPAERRELRARAHHLHPVVAIGQHGLTPSVLREIEVNLRAHELIKVRAFSDIRGEREAMLGQICAKLTRRRCSISASCSSCGVLRRRSPPKRASRAAAAVPAKRAPTMRGRPAATIREAKKGGNSGKETRNAMAKSAPQARRPRDPAARTPVRPPSTQGEGRRGPKGVPSAPVSRERRRRRAP